MYNPIVNTLFSDNDETKKKMYSCIVVVGGGMMMEGAQQWLQYRVWVGMPPQYRLMLETMDVLTRPKVKTLIASMNSVV